MTVHRLDHQYTFKYTFMLQYNTSARSSTWLIPMSFFMKKCVFTFKSNFIEIAAMMEAGKGYR